MNIIKKYAWPTIIILVASIIVTFAILPLANTEFADDIRTGAVTEGEGSEAGGEPEMPGAIRYLAGFIKEFAMMGVAGVITYTILRITRHFSRKRKKPKPALDAR